MKKKPPKPITTKTPPISRTKKSERSSAPVSLRCSARSARVKLSRCAAIQAALESAGIEFTTSTALDDVQQISASAFTAALVLT